MAETETETLELLPPPSSPPPGDTGARQLSLEAEREVMNRRPLAQRSVESLGEADGGDKWQRGERDAR